MNPSLSISQLKQLRLIMQMMLSEAKNANWQELSRLDSERRVLINYRTVANDTHTNQVVPTPSQRQQPPAIKTESTLHARTESKTADIRSSSVLNSNTSACNPGPDYLALSTELTTIDKEISETVQAARQALLEQSRGLKAQISAKKGYEQANIMKVSSYS